MCDFRPRLLPDEPLPPYSFVPGSFPHPVSDPAGHSYGHTPAPPAPLDPERWSECRDYLLGFDLFNHGNYWEANETWEGLWHAAGRHGATADLLQGLITLAAAGVKVREGRSAGTFSHARGARDLFARAAGRTDQQSVLLGLAVADLEAFTRQAEGCASDKPDSDLGVRVVFPFVLMPRLESGS